MKHLLWRGHRHGRHLLEVERMQNKLIVSYGKPHEEKPAPKVAGHELILSTKINKSKEKPMVLRRCVLDMAKYIEPFKSKKDYYDKMRANATNYDEENLEIV